MRGDIMAKRSSFGSIVRKRLSDITNSLPQTQQKTPIEVDKISPDAASSKDYINHLVKENVALVKLVQDKNKIIELSGNEIQKLRIHLQKLQLQNWNIAQSNSHMLAELHLNREKIKSLQHDLVCKEALLKSKSLEEEQEQRNQLKNGLQDEDFMVIDSPPKRDSKPKNSNRRQRGTRSQSMGHSTTSQQAADKEAAENKRRCLRRKSASAKVQQPEPAAEDLFELEGLAVPFNSPVNENGLTPLPYSGNEEEKDEKNSSENVAQRSRRSSIVRPSRKAAEKVQSYKEIPVNIKMRRDA